MLRLSLKLALATASIPLLACTTPSAAPRIDAPVLAPRANEAVVIDHLVTLVDASSSVPARTLFRDQKALVESVATSMPDGRYDTATITFGGFRRDRESLEAFDRTRAVGRARELRHLSEGTPIHKAIAEAGTLLEGKRGRAAVLLYSDGLLTDEVGRAIDQQLAFDAARELRAGYDGLVCFHTVQTGSDPAGTQFLRRLSQSSQCGTYRRADAITSVASLQQFEREVFLGAAPRPIDVAAAPRDTDGDGVLDPNDLCPGSPRGSAVDSRGCWVVKGLLFAVNSSLIEPSGHAALDEVANVLRANPQLRVRIDGHTDSSGSDHYNVWLSNRRAEAARRYLVAAGIDASRLEAQGWGERTPAADNATREGRRANRRTEITILR